MGTRNLTVIIKDNEIKLSQYCQWNGYFSYTGVKFLEFVKNRLQGRNRHTGKKTKDLYKYQIKDFKEKVNLLTPVNQNYINMASQCQKDMETETLSIPFEVMFPQFSVSTGVEILDIINEHAQSCKLRGKKFPVALDIKKWDAEFINVIDMDNESIYMLTYHEFKGEPLEVPEIIKETYPMPCWYKAKFQDIPRISEIKKYKESIGLDYYQKESGEWVSY